MRDLLRHECEALPSGQATNTGLGARRQLQEVVHPIDCIRFRLLLAYLAFLGYMLFTPSPPGSGGNDLVGHAGAFGLLGMLVWWNLPAGPWREVVAMVVAGLIGAATELGQGLVPGRTMSVADGAADMVGAGLGVAVMALVGRRVAFSPVGHPA